MQTDLAAPSLTSNSSSQHNLHIEAQRLAISYREVYSYNINIFAFYSYHMMPALMILIARSGVIPDASCILYACKVGMGNRNGMIQEEPHVPIPSYLL